jgi:hypothetical protein
MAFRFYPIPLVLLVILLSILATAQKKEKKVMIAGTVVAESIDIHPCTWHICSLEMVVRLDEKGRTEYVVVNLTYMDDRSRPQNGKPLELVQKAGRWKFTATSETEEELERYWNVQTRDGKDLSEEFKQPAWLLLPGAENEILPFGTLVRRYSVRVGKFKQLK